MESNPMELLQEDMANDESYVKINAIHRLKIIATIIGQDGIKNQLIPYIDSLIKKEEDEVLFAIAEELINLTSMIPNYLPIILPLYEQLCSAEETVVRERAVKSVISLSNGLNENEIQTYFVPLILRLANNEANFTHRVAAVNMLIPVYTRSGQQHKEKLRQKFSELCGEETPMVRRVVASLIGELSIVVEKEFVINEFIQNIKQLVGDEQDQVRVLALKSLRQIGKVLNKDENKQHTLPIIIASIEDKSWQVRRSLAQIFSELAEAFGKDISDVSLIQIFTNLLRDPENEVRIASIQSLIKFIKLISVDKLVIIIPHLQYLVKDSVPIVRSSTIEVIGILSGIVTKDIANQRLLNLLSDTFNDDAKEVRENVVKAAAQFIINIGSELINTFLLLFKKCLEDTKWRVRLETYDALIKISKQNYNPDLFQKSIEPLFLGYLKDKTATIREECADKLQILIGIYKNEWVFGRLLPKLNECLNKENSYLFRLAALNSLRVVAKSINPDQAVDKIFPIFNKHLADPVPNIRLFTIKIYKEIIKQFDSPQVRNEIKTNINNILSTDQDKDVKFYAQELLTCL